MAGPFVSVRFHVGEKNKAELNAFTESPQSFRGAVAPAAGGAQPSFENDEAAARFYADRVFRKDSRPRVRGLSAPAEPALMPALRLRDVTAQRLTKTKLVRFEQQQASIP